MATVIFLAKISFKNGRMLAVNFSPLILVEYRPSWSKFIKWLVFCGQFGNNSANFGVSSAKIGAEN
jgi:hypothetical protein